MIMQVHDELVFEVAEDRSTACASASASIMQGGRRARRAR
jgi:DNA polymerase I-like protein with 3'-5' exonuclease and polymerase domains